MNLTIEQLSAVRSGAPVAIDDPEIGTECVLLRADVFQRIESLLSCDSEFLLREAHPMINEIMREDDENDPWLESYQQA
jgi:hypothetical protein